MGLCVICFFLLHIFGSFFLVNDGKDLFDILWSLALQIQRFALPLHFRFVLFKCMHACW